jgi:hypothetical protein
MEPNDNQDNQRVVVMEGSRRPQPRLKQYVVLVENSNIKGLKKAKKHTVIRMTSEEAIPYVSAHILTPLDIAIKEGVYPPKKDTLVEKLKTATQESKDRPVAQNLQQTTSTKEDEKKSFLGNKLREAIQQRKEETTESQSTPTVLPADKLAAIQSGGQPTPDEDKN